MKIPGHCVTVGFQVAGCIAGGFLLVVWILWSSINGGEALSLWLLGHDKAEGWFAGLLLGLQGSIIIGVGAAIDCCNDANKPEEEKETT